MCNNLRKISLVEEFTFDPVWENKSAVKSNERMNTSNFQKALFKSKSLSDLLDEDEEIHFVGNIQQRPKISQGLSQKGKILQKCRGCRRLINLVLSRHHCRVCGDIFCKRCTRYRKYRGDTNTPDSKGHLHRVCLFCITESEETGEQKGMSKSWTEEFFKMRSQYREDSCFKPCKPATNYGSEMPAVCLPIIDQFLDYVTKRNPTGIHERIQAAMKVAKRDMACSSCKRSLIIPTDRKLCSICGDIACKNCSSKNLVVYFPRNVKCASGSFETIQPHVKFMDDVTGISEKADVWQNYRVCDPCKTHLDHVLNVNVFNLDLEDVHSELTSLQSQITSVLSKVSKKSRNIANSVECLCDNFNSDQKDADAADLDKLFTRYFCHHRQLAALTPVTNTQTTLLKNIQSAVTTFYINMRCQFPFRFRFQQREVPLNNAAQDM